MFQAKNSSYIFEKKWSMMVSFWSESISQILTYAGSTKVVESWPNCSDLEIANRSAEIVLPAYRFLKVGTLWSASDTVISASTFEDPFEISEWYVKAAHWYKFVAGDQSQILDKIFAQSAADDQSRFKLLVKQLD